MNSNRTSPNHALQRTAPRVTLAAADRPAAFAHPAPTAFPQPARRAPQSLSLGSLGDFRTSSMNRAFLLLSLAILSPFIGRCAEAVPAIAVLTESIGLVAPGTDSGPHFLTVAWRDGRIVWSRNQQSGGAPYLTARIEPARITELLKQFEARGVFTKPGLRRSWLGPDSSSHAICLSSGNRQTRLATWHELFERNPKLVVVNGGVTSLDGRNRDEVIRNDTKEFQEFRRVWSDLRAAITALIPADGEPYSGAMTFKLPQ